MSEKAEKRAKRKADLEKKRRRFAEMGYIIAGISEDDSDSEKDDVKEQTRQRVENEAFVKEKGLALANNALQSPTVISAGDDPTWGEVTICIAGTPKVTAGGEDWLACVAKFDTGTDDDWISEKLVAKVGLLQEKAEPWECKNFDGTIFISDQHINRLTWMREEAYKTNSGTFRILPEAPFDLLIGSKTIFRTKIFVAPTRAPHAAGVLVIKKITKEQEAANKLKALEHKAISDAHLAQQSSGSGLNVPGREKGNNKQGVQKKQTHGGPR